MNTTRYIATRGWSWSEDELCSLGCDATDEEVVEFANKAVSRFHFLVDERDGSFHWTPKTSEVSALVEWEADDKINIEELRDQAIQEVWDEWLNGT